MDYNLELEKKISYLEGQLEEKNRTLELLKELYLKKDVVEYPAIPYGTGTNPWPWSKFTCTTSPYTVTSSNPPTTSNKLDTWGCSPYWLDGVSKITV